MRKFNFAKIISFVFICAVLMSALAIAAFATEENTVEIVSQNVYFGEKYQLMYAVNAPEGATVSAKDSKGNAIDVELFAKDPANNDGVKVADYAYILAEGVAAQAIDEVITFTVECDGVSASKSYSVLQYVYERTQGVSSNQATGTELAMFNAFITFADAANVHIDEATGSFNDYVYVTVEGATVNGVNPTGMYAAGATPFANLELALDYDDANQILRWYADDVLTDLDAIKAIVVADKNIAVKAVVLDKCFDGHTMIAPTCQKDGYCDVCGAAGDPKVDHKDENGDYKCDYDCGTNVLPAADSVLTIEQAIAIGNLYTQGNYTTDKYYVTGTVKSVYNTTYGNMYITDANGTEFTVYGTYSADGSNRYDAMTEKPGAGDTVTVYGVIGYYTSAQMQNAWITEYTVHTHVYSDATCLAPATCSLCGITEGEKTDHVYVDGICTGCGMKEPSADQTITTVEKTHTEMATIAGVTAGQNTGNIKDKEIAFDDNITITCAQGKSTSAPCIYSESIRLYQGGATITIAAKNGASIQSVVITLATKSGGQGPITVSGGTASELSNYTYTITADEGVSTIVITTAGTDKNNRLYVAGIEVTYAK